MVHRADVVGLTSATSLGVSSRRASASKASTSSSVLWCPRSATRVRPRGAHYMATKRSGLGSSGQWRPGGQVAVGGGQQGLKLSRRRRSADRAAGARARTPGSRWIAGRCAQPARLGHADASLKQEAQILLLIKVYADFLLQKQGQVNGLSKAEARMRLGCRPGPPCWLRGALAPVDRSPTRRATRLSP